MSVVKKLSLPVVVLILALGTISLVGCDKNQDGNNAQAPTTTVTSEKEVNANWTIDVNDKHTVDVQGLPIDYTLQFKATKAGGTDPTGTYKGTAHLIVKSDFSKFKGIPQSVIKVMGGVNGQGNANGFTFKVVNFADARKHASETGNSDANAPLATLVPPSKGKKTSATLPEPTAEDKAVANPDFYSYGSMKMSGMGSLNAQATGINGEHAQFATQKSASEQVNFSMNIVGATVYIDIPKAGRFKGTVTGDPIK